MADRCFQIFRLDANVLSCTMRGRGVQIDAVLHQCFVAWRVVVSGEATKTGLGVAGRFSAASEVRMANSIDTPGQAAFDCRNKLAGLPALIRVAGRRSASGPFKVVNARLQAWQLQRLPLPFRPVMEPSLIP